MIKNTFHFWALHPRRVFLLDGAGAGLSAFLLGVVVAGFEPFFGLRPSIAYGLAGIAGLLAGYSLGCYFYTDRHWRPFLKGVIITNVLYCCLTLGLGLVLYEELHIWGRLYFLVEILVIIALVIFETTVLRSRFS